MRDYFVTITVGRRRTWRGSRRPSLLCTGKDGKGCIPPAASIPRRDRHQAWATGGGASSWVTVAASCSATSAARRSTLARTSAASSAPGPARHPLRASPPWTPGARPPCPRTVRATLAGSPSNAAGSGRLVACSFASDNRLGAGRLFTLPVLDHVSSAWDHENTGRRGVRRGGDVLSESGYPCGRRHGALRKGPAGQNSRLVIRRSPCAPASRGPAARRGGHDSTPTSPGDPSIPRG